MFGNPLEWVVAAMVKACNKMKHFDLDVRIVSYARPAESLIDQFVAQFAAPESDDESAADGEARAASESGDDWPLKREESPQAKSEHKRAAPAEAERSECETKKAKSDISRFFKKK